MQLLEGRDVTPERTVLRTLLEEKLGVEEQRDRLNEFVGMLSHEVKTPINVVANALDFLSETEMSPRQEEYFEIALEGARTLTETLRSSLELSRAVALDSSHQRDEAPYNLRARLIEAVRPLSRLTVQRGLGFEHFVEAEVGEHYFGDWPRIKQVLTILLDNAVKYTDDGGVGLKVSLLSRSESGDCLRFEVVDTGPGIEHRKAEMIFLPFQRASSTQEGFGLGLPVAHRLARVLGGELKVTSEPGQGSTFALVLVQQACSAPDEPSETLFHGLEGYRVLLLEDNPINLSVVTLMLEKMGLEVVGCRRPTEALEIAAGESFDVVVTDIGLPEMSGVEFVTRFKAISHCRSTPVIASTGSASDRERSVYEAAGIAMTLEKPFNRTSLQDALKQVLKCRTIL
jgi:CheY-like chemotaxis protein